MTGDVLLSRRATAQRLGRRRERDVVAAVRAAGGLQAQRWDAAELAVHARSRGLVAADVVRARDVDRSVLRVWSMRSTLHLVAADDAAWILAAVGPVMAARGARRRTQLGLDDESAARGVRVVRDALACGPMSRRELEDTVIAAGIAIAPRSQAVVHLIALASLQGVVCEGPWRGHVPTFVLFDDWLGRQPQVDRGAAIAQLARTHLRAYGPAKPEDFASWSGLPAGEVRTAWRAIAAEIQEVAAPNGPMWILGRPGRVPGAGGVRLLPHFDTYLQGYRDRSLMLAPDHRGHVWPGGGWLHPTLAVDGRLVATWRLTAGSDVVSVTPFCQLHDDVVRTVQAEVADMGRFLGRPLVSAL